MADTPSKLLWDLTSADMPPTDPSGEIDIEQIEYNLSLTPDQRLRQYFDWLDFMHLARKAGRDFYGMELRVSEETD
jgi:hypothetical protein